MKNLLDCWSEGKSDFKAYPWMFYISLTNICNSRCSICPHDTVMRDDKGVMSFDLFQKIVDQLPSDVKKVYLMKQGEPFIHPKLEDCIAYLRGKRPDINISFHTNGILAKKDRVRKILSMVDSIGISVGGITPDIYMRAHGVDKFDDVMKNIKDISDLLIENKDEKIPHVFIDYVEQIANSSEKKEDAVSYYKKNFPGLSSVDFHWVYNFQGETDEGNIDVYNQIPYEKFPQCVFPWSSMTACHDGKVTYCFVEPRENRFLGDFSTQNFDEIWNGTEYKKFRRNMVDKNFRAMAEDGFYCHKCSWLWSMKSQSPKNLVGGYALTFKDNSKNYDFGDLLDVSIEKKYEYAEDAFNSGEIDRSIGILTLLSETGEGAGMETKIKELKDRCLGVLAKYKNLNLWQQEMQKDNIDIDERKCSYYKIGDK